MILKNMIQLICTKVCWCHCAVVTSLTNNNVFVTLRYYLIKKGNRHTALIKEGLLNKTKCEGPLKEI